MTVENLNVRYKIEVDGIDSFTQILPATITTDFIEGEIVTGLTSGVTAVVDRVTTGTPDQIYIRTKIEFFISEETLTGSAGGEAVKTGNIEVLQAPYDSTEFGIENGVWTLLSDEELLTKINDPVQKINISQGGNIASGYSFGFEVTNFEFAKALEVDGVFFRNRKCTLYIGTVALGVTTWSSEWVGLVDSFDISEKFVNFTCTDLTKMNTDSVGSDLVPIALNRNYNCKLIKDESEVEYIPINMYLGLKSSFATNLTASNGQAIITFKYSEEMYDFIEAGEFNNVILEVIFGGGLGLTYSVVGAINDSSSNPYNLPYMHTLTLDNSKNLNEIKVKSEHYLDTITKDSSFFMLKQYKNDYNLSNNPVKIIHTVDGQSSKKLTLINDGNEYKPSSSIYGIVDSKIIRLKNLLSEDSITLIETVESALDTEKYNDINAYGIFNSISDDGTVSSGGISNFAVNYNSNYVDKIIEVFSKFENKYCSGFKIVIPDAAILTSGSSFFIYALEADSIVDYCGFNYFKSIIKAGPQGSYSFLSEEDLTSDDGWPIIASFSEGSTTNLFNLEIEFSCELSLENITEEKGLLDSLVSFGNIKLLNMPSNEFVTSKWSSDVVNDISLWDIDLIFEGKNEVDIGDLSVGCNGENVYGETYDVATVPQTIDYLLTNYYDKTASDIDSVSFDQANTDFSLFVNDPVRNPAHQITKQTDGNELLSSILYANHLGMYINRSGKYTLENWLPKSIIFSTTSTLADFDETNTISIGEIKGDNLNSVVSDFQLSADLSESTGEYNRILRVKNPNESVFDFARDIEGVDANDEGLAFSAWQLASAGYNRINKLSQTEKKSKWHKLAFSDGTGTSESIAFIRNQLAHVNREHKFITFSVPYNTTNLGFELLSFISISDQKITDDVARKGWIVERKLNLKNDTITWKLLLDISQFDPFLYRVNVWRDGAYITNVKTDGEYPDNIKSNGTGI